MTVEFPDVRQAREEREVIGGFTAHDQLLPVLHAVTDRIGWISPRALSLIASTLGVRPAEVATVVRTHPRFSLEERPGRQLRVCTDVACRDAGADTVCDVLTEHVGAAGKAVAGVMWLRSPCLGACEEAPAALAFQAGDPPVTERLAPATGASAVLSTRRPLVPESDVDGSWAHTCFAVEGGPAPVDLSAGRGLFSICERKIPDSEI